MTQQTDQAKLRAVTTGSVTGFLAMGFFSGLSPKAPGTAGSALALALMWPMMQLPFVVLIAFVLASAVLGVFICQDAAKRLGVHDHSAIVWDEFVGMWLVLLWVPQTITMWIVAFVFFRFFDVVKPWPIGWMDRRLSGGVGIMVDDLMAAFYAIVVIHLAITFWPALPIWLG